MADLSSFYKLTVANLDGVTALIHTIGWGPSAPTKYRTYTVPDDGNVGVIPVNAFTRSLADVHGDNRSPIAESGAIIVARFAPATENARIAVIPSGGTQLSQFQPLTRDPSARLWTFPGDSIWVRDSLPARGDLDFFVRPLNHEELDELLTLTPPAATAETNPVVLVGTDPAIPLMRGKRTIYLVTPPVAEQLYFLPNPAAVGIGDELVFVGMNNTSFNLNAHALNGGVNLSPFRRVPGGGTVTMIGIGSAYAHMGSRGIETGQFGPGDQLDPWRQDKIHRFNVPAPEMFVIPALGLLPKDVYFMGANVGPATITLTGAGAETFNGDTDVEVPPGFGVILRPFGTNWVGVIA